MTALSEAIRSEIRAILEEKDNDALKPFDIPMAVRIAKVALAAKGMLLAAGGVPEAIMSLNEDHAIEEMQEEQTVNPGIAVNGGVTLQQSLGSALGLVGSAAGMPTSLATAGVPETFGVKMLREIAAAMPRLVEALARKKGEPQVAMPALFQEDSLQLVRAIKEAKDAGMTSIAEALEARLVANLAAAAPAALTPQIPPNGVPVKVSSDAEASA